MITQGARTSAAEEKRAQDLAQLMRELGESPAPIPAKSRTVSNLAPTTARQSSRPAAPSSSGIGSTPLPPTTLPSVSLSTYPAALQSMFSPSPPRANSALAGILAMGETPPVRALQALNGPDPLRALQARDDKLSNKVGIMGPPLGTKRTAGKSSGQSKSRSEAPRGDQKENLSLVNRQ